MRRAVLALLLVAAVAVAALALVAADQRRTLAFTLGVQPALPAATLQPGQRVCQLPVLVEEPFDVVEAPLASGGTSGGGPRVAVSVRALGSGAALATGTLPVGWTDGFRAISVGRVRAGQAVAICLRDLGPAPLAVLGGADAAARTSSASLDGVPTGTDLALVLRTAQPRSTLALLPDMLERAALFRGGWSGAWTYWALLAAVLLGVPALLARALSATGPPTSAGDGGTPPARREPAAAPRSGDTARA